MLGGNESFNPYLPGSMSIYRRVTTSFDGNNLVLRDQSVTLTGQIFCESFVAPRHLSGFAILAIIANLNLGLTCTSKKQKAQRRTQLPNQVWLKIGYPIQPTD